MTTLPVQTDTEIAELSEQAARLQLVITRAAHSFHIFVGDRKVYRGRHQSWSLTDAEAEERAVAGTGVAPYDVRSVAMTLARRDEAREELLTVRGRIAELNSVWRANGFWSRFFLVQGGHIHSSTECSTCNNGASPTEFGWLPELSGLTEAEAVAAHGAILCTVCFPSAPVEWTNAYELAEAAKAAARCPGSGKGYNSDKPHQLLQNSKWGYCLECDTRQTVTPTGAIRAHKKP